MATVNVHMIVIGDWNLFLDAMILQHGITQAHFTASLWPQQAHMHTLVLILASVSIHFHILTNLFCMMVYTWTVLENSGVA